MTLVESNFHKHGHTTFGVWLPGGETVCIAFRDDQKVIVGFLKPMLWNAIQGQRDMAAQLRRNSDFYRIYDVRIIKSGWFMFATVDFTLALGTVLRGKTDKRFAEFLASISWQE